jgi:hypothetical protein
LPTHPSRQSPRTDPVRAHDDSERPFDSASTLSVHALGPRKRRKRVGFKRCSNFHHAKAPDELNSAPLNDCQKLAGEPASDVEPRARWTKYFRTSSSNEPGVLRSIERVIWNDIDASDYADDSARAYQAAVLDQYRLCVEMADRVSARRGASNTFFLTLNSAIFSLIGVFWEKQPAASDWILVFPLIVLVVQCMAWFWMIRSYRQLSSGKFAVVGVLEKRLPASAFQSAEWSALGRGKDPTRYWPLTRVETIVPVLFRCVLCRCVCCSRLDVAETICGGMSEQAAPLRRSPLRLSPIVHPGGGTPEQFSTL